MTPVRCQRAVQMDMVAFLEDPQGAGWEEFRQHVQRCVDCQTAIAQWTQLDALLQAFGKEGPVTHPAAEQLAAYERSPQRLSAEARQTVEEHLRYCPYCVEELAAARALDFSRFQRWIDKEKLAPARLETKAGTLSRLIIQIGHNSLRLLESHLTPPLLGLQEMVVPNPAYRREEVPPTLNLRLTSGQVDITARVRQEGKQIALTLTFLSAEQGALAGQQVFLRRRGRVMFSAQTDSKGVLRMPRLKPGIYEVACPGLQATFELEFRS